MTHPGFDQVRFIAALSRHQPALEAFCYAQLGNLQDTREVLQSTCVKLWEKAAEWDPETDFLKWAFAVARFTLLSYIRDRMRDRLVFDEDVVLAMAQETEAAATEFEEKREALRTCMQKLVPQQQSFLREHYIVRRTLREIASDTNRSESSLKMMMMRLREQLRKCIHQELRRSL